MSATMIRLGAHGPQVFPLALGCMGMSGGYAPADERESIATIQAAVDAGVQVLDTGDFYGMGHNEMLIRRALKGRRERALLSVKFGALRGPDQRWGGVDARPEATANFLAYSLQRLGVDRIDIYRPARLDPAVPIEETMGELSRLIDKGYIRFVGLSEVGVETIERAQAVLPIADVQLEYGVASRGPEQRIFPRLHELGVGATLYGVLGRGLLTGRRSTGPKDFRTYLPRFAQYGDHNQPIVAAFAAFAEARDMTPAQLAVAWVRAKQPGFLPLIGARTRTQLQDIVESLSLALSEDDLQALDQVIPADSIHGARYPEAAMEHLDSER